LRAGRKRKIGVSRTNSGAISRAGKAGVSAETLALRERQLKSEGLILKFRKLEGGREVEKRTAEDRLSGYTLGKLLLRTRQGQPNGINQAQFEALEAWSSLVVARKSIDDSRKLESKTPSFVMVGGGGDSSEGLDQSKIDRIRRRWLECEYELNQLQCPWKIKQAMYGVCMEGWLLDQLSEMDLSNLRTGADAVIFGLG
jgi:hypothetical protein